MKPLILASTSPFRGQLLRDFGIAYRAHAPSFEERVPDAPLPPLAVASRFARGKALSLRETYPNHWILGSDQVPAFENAILRKPVSTEDAVEQLLRLQGRTHHLHTAVCLLDSASGVLYEDSVTHTMTMRSLQRSEARAYALRDEPIGCAGGYKIEKTGVALFEQMAGVDHTAIIGLPISTLGNLFEKAGESWMQRVGASLLD